MGTRSDTVVVLGGQGARRITWSLAPEAYAVLEDPALRTLTHCDELTLDGLPGDVAQPLIVAYHLARAAAATAGRRVAGVVGQSLGEISAAAVAGAIEPGDAVALARGRARLAAELLAADSWAMLAITGHQVDAIAADLDPVAEVATVNSPVDVIVAGPRRSLEDLVEHRQVGLAQHRFLPVFAPYHTTAMAPVAGAFRDVVAALSPRKPRVPLYSPTLQRLVTTPADVTDALVGALVTTLDWRAALRQVAERWPDAEFVDCSPSSALTRFVGRNGVDISWRSTTR